MDDPNIAPGAGGDRSWPSVGWCGSCAIEVDVVEHEELGQCWFDPEHCPDCGAELQYEDDAP